MVINSIILLIVFKENHTLKSTFFSFRSQSYKVFSIFASDLNIK